MFETIDYSDLLIRMAVRLGAAILCQVRWDLRERIKERFEAAGL